ncbi:hypothetical protein [uncultured Fluviicola sp.]|uniref:hypothetical protein n=1 Tax=uncultured Fluviicola sp. TaxID=463303 RepID=UPI0025EB58BB|nr:hypothetical protein [uncultured Fluviicola sp.]
MKLLLRGSLTLILLQLFSFSYGQTVTQQLTLEQVTGRLNDVYGSNFLLQNPELPAVYAKIINERIDYIVTAATTDEKYALLSSVPLMTKLNPEIQGANFLNFNLNEFNPLAYYIDYFSDRTQVYRVDNTDYIMVIKPVTRN